MCSAVMSSFVCASVTIIVIMRARMYAGLIQPKLIASFELIGLASSIIVHINVIHDISSLALHLFYIIILYYIVSPSEIY